MVQKIKNIVTVKLPFLGSVVVMLLGSFFTPLVSANIVGAQSATELRNQANDLQQMIDDNKATANNLSDQVETLQGKIAELDGQIADTQTKITETESKIAALSAELEKTKLELERQREILKSNLKQLYKTTGATSVELLFASDDFNSFINKQQYLEQLKNGIKKSLDSVIALKKDLESKKAEQEVLEQGLQAQKKGLQDSRAERELILQQTQGEEARYRAMVEDLQNQQKEINRKLAAMATSISYAGTGSYPWADVGGDNVGFYSCYGSDPWGMCYRQCVSYTAWKVASSGRYMPTSWVGGRGNANMWMNSALEDGIPVDKNPRPGDVAVWSFGPLGHAMYVEDVYDNGMIRVSQYNFGVPGSYSEMTIPASQNNMSFIHFP